MNILNEEQENISTPQVSIIIPVFNNFELTKNCIKSINNAELKTSYEIIIADDCSTDETINIENYFKNVRLIKTPKNSGFLLNVKNAIPYSRGTYIFLMNNDMIAKPKFLDYIYETITKNTKIGVVGAVMLNEDNTIQEAGATIYTDGSSEWNFHGRKEINTSITYNVDYCSGCGIMFLREDWNLLGGFDERFIPAYYEDTDFCFQIKYILGKQIICQPKAQIYHIHKQTYKEETSNISAQNQIKFLKKWENKLYKTRNLSHDNFWKKIFSVKHNDKHKVITIFGIKIRIKCKD